MRYLYRGLKVSSKYHYYKYYFTSEQKFSLTSFSFTFITILSFKHSPMTGTSNSTYEDIVLLMLKQTIRCF